MTEKERELKHLSFLLIFILFISTFSVGVYAEEHNADTETPVTFSTDVAGITPDSFWYFLDFTHTTEETIHEMGLMAEAGDYDSYRQALENFNEEVAEEAATLESASLEGVTLEAIESDSHEGANTVVETQINVLTYEEYADAIEEIFETQVESGDASEEEVEELIQDLNAPVNTLGGEVEHATQELYDTAGDNSGVSEQEVVLVYEDNIREQVGDRFNEISSIQNVVELDAKIAELEQEIANRETEGDTEGVAEVRSLLDLARSHGENCLNSEENNFDIEGVNHINAGEDIVNNVESYINGELSEEEYQKFITLYSPPAEEDIREEIEDNNEDATRFIENYEGLKEKYSSDLEKLAYIEQEKTRSERVQELTEKLSDEGVIDNWFEEFATEGLGEGEIAEKVYERWVDRYELINGHYTPPGTIVLPGDDAETETQGEETIGEEIPIGRIERVERIDAETGKVIIEYVGFRDGEFIEHENLEEGGGFALGVPYEYDGVAYTYGVAGYSVEADGVVYTYSYPTEGYNPADYYNYGDEVTTFTTENGDVITYSATGYEIKSSEGDVISEDAYTVETVTFADGSSLDNEATGFVFNDNEGKAYVYSYNTEIRSYSDTTTGKVYVPPTPTSHTESTVYDSTTGVYKYNYAGVEWTTDGSGTWTSAAGQRVSLSTVPAPVGYENVGTWTTPSGKIWTYDSSTNKWTETTSGSSYVPAPNNWYRYEERTGRYIDNYGKRFDSSGGESSYITPWSYNSASRQWVSSETGDTYDPSTGIITHPDRTTFTETENTGEPPCYGCYYGGGQGTSGPYTYTYDYGSHYERTPQGSYSYYNSRGDYIGPSSTTDAYGNIWSRNDDGSWSSSTGQTYSPGGYYTGAGSYTGAAIGTIVVGDDGQTYTVTNDRGWTDSQGNAVSPPIVGGMQQPSSAVGGGYYGYTGGGGYDPAAAAAGWPGGAYPGGVAPYSGPYTGPVGGEPYSSYPGGYYGTNDPAGPNYNPAATATAGYPATGGYYYTGGGGYDSQGNYVGGEYGGYDSGAYTSEESYSYDSSTGTYTSSGGGDTSTGGTYDSGGSTGGGTGSTGGDSGGSTGGGGGDGGGGDGGGGGSTGAVIAEGNTELSENFISKFFEWVKNIFG